MRKFGRSYTRVNLINGLFLLRMSLELTVCEFIDNTPAVRPRLTGQLKDDRNSCTFGRSNRNNGESCEQVITDAGAAKGNLKQTSCYGPPHLGCIFVYFCNILSLSANLFSEFVFDSAQKLRKIIRHPLFPGRRIFHICFSPLNYVVYVLNVRSSLKNISSWLILARTCCWMCSKIYGSCQFVFLNALPTMLLSLR